MKKLVAILMALMMLTGYAKAQEKYVTESQHKAQKVIPDSVINPKYTTEENGKAFFEEGGTDVSTGGVIRGSGSFHLFIPDKTKLLYSKEVGKNVVMNNKGKTLIPWMFMISLFVFCLFSVYAMKSPHSNLFIKIVIGVAVFALFVTTNIYGEPLLYLFGGLMILTWILMAICSLLVGDNFSKKAAGYFFGVSIIVQGGVSLLLSTTVFILPTILGLTIGYILGKSTALKTNAKKTQLAS